MDFELSKEQQDIQKAAREFAVGEFREIARDCDLNEEFPRSLLEKAGDLGFIGVFIDEEYGGVHNGKVDHALIAMAKWFSAEMAVRCADEALQMHGGYGYIDEYKVQRLYRDAKVLEIYEGTKEMEKTIVSRSILG